MMTRFSLRAILCAVLILAGLAPTAFPKDKAAQSVWTSVPVTVDASCQEWGGGPLLAEEAAGAEVAFRNDGQYLFLLLIIKDKAYLSTLDSTGITIFFDNTGKKSKNRGIRFFKVRATAEELILVFEKRGQALTEEQKSEIRSRQQYALYECEYLEGKKTTLVEPRADSPLLFPTFKSQAEAEKTVFEFRLPLSREIQAWGIGATSGAVLKIGLEWGGLTGEMKAQRLARTVAASERAAQSDVQSESHDSSGRRDSGGAGASSMGMGRGTPKKYSFWLDVKLAASERP